MHRFPYTLRHLYTFFTLLDASKTYKRAQPPVRLCRVWGVALAEIDGVSRVWPGGLINEFSPEALSYMTRLT